MPPVQSRMKSILVLREVKAAVLLSKYSTNRKSAMVQAFKDLAPTAQVAIVKTSLTTIVSYSGIKKPRKKGGTS